jgi:hypothetical protein
MSALFNFESVTPSACPRGSIETLRTDRVSYSEDELDAKINVALGGRVAEEVVYGKITTGVAPERGLQPNYFPAPAKPRPKRSGRSTGKCSGASRKPTPP